MGKEWTDDEVTEEIRKAFAIFREDHIVKSIRGLEEKLSGLAGKGNSSSDPVDPPKKNQPNNGDKPRRSMWWGEVDNND